MIQISKDEAFEMRKQCGMSSVKYSYNKRHRHYYLVESDRNMEALKKYRDSRTVLCVTAKDIKKQKQ